MTPNAPRKFFVIAGENSGDMLASYLIRAIQRKDPTATFRGLGGPEMEACGVEPLMNIVRSLAIIGLTQVLKNIRKLFKVFKYVEDALLTDRPDAVILVDYPGFNLRVAKLAKQLGIPVIYYVMPQVWAWHKSRIKNIRENVDLMLVFLPFEEEYCKKHGVNVRYSGHPLLDIIKLTRDREEVCANFGLNPQSMLIGLLPGSRKPEIVRILPVMLDACERLHDEYPDWQFVLPRATSVPLRLVEKYAARYQLPMTIVESERYNVRSTFDFALVKSGTATLETTVLECPMIIIYKTSWLTWLIGKTMVELHYIGLPNILAEKMIVPELLQEEACGERIATEVKNILNDPENLKNVKYELKRVKAKLGEPGASEKAAGHILELLDAKSDARVAEVTERHAQG